MVNVKVTSGYGENPARKAEGSKAVRRSLLSHGQQKAFQAALEEAQISRGKICEPGKICPPKGKFRVQPPAACSAEDALKTRARVKAVPETGTLESLAASTLLKVAELTSRGGVWKGCGLTGLRAPGGGSEIPGSAAAVGISNDERARRSAAPAPAGGPGSVSALFESSGSGVDAIGYDSNGGTSYGLYQISSRQGTMKDFLGYLSENAPDIAERLKAAGPADTGSTRGAMPAAWKRIAALEPERFADLQRGFIEKGHYAPALQEIVERAGFHVGERSEALQEALWSTAVQHGPGRAARIFRKAIDKIKAKGTEVSDEELIERIYAARAGDFGSSSVGVQAAVRRRFREEKEILLSMLQRESDRSPSNSA